MIPLNLPSETHRRLNKGQAEAPHSKFAGNWSRDLYRQFRSCSTSRSPVMFHDLPNSGILAQRLSALMKDETAQIDLEIPQAEKIRRAFI